MRVLTLSRYDRRAASGRLRFLQYADRLERRGIELVWAPLFDDEYLAVLFAGQRPARHLVARAMVRRMADVLTAHRYVAAIIHSDSLPYVVPVVEALLRAQRVPWVFDFDDAVQHGYDMHPNPVVRRVLGGKVAHVIRHAAAVTAGSAYLRDYAAQFNRNVHLVPTVVDTDVYRVRQHEPRDGVTIGWIGSASTTKYLDLVAPALTRLARQRDIRLLTVGATAVSIDGVEIERRAWSEAREVDDLLDMDIGIMPLTDDPWSRGKCAFKLIQYMATGLPVVASPVGANRDVVSPDCGFLADTDDAWVDALSRLADDVDLRARLGTVGRRRIVEGYSVAAHADAFADILLGAAR